LAKVLDDFRRYRADIERIDIEHMDIE
jgi:hypothetical protein